MCWCGLSGVLLGLVYIFTLSFGSQLKRRRLSLCFFFKSYLKYERRQVEICKLLYFFERILVSLNSSRPVLVYTLASSGDNHHKWRQLIRLLVSNMVSNGFWTTTLGSVSNNLLTAVCWMKWVIFQINIYFHSKQEKSSLLCLWSVWTTLWFKILMNHEVGQQHSYYTFVIDFISLS